MVPIIQTMTRAFKFEKNYGDKYSDGSENDKLRKIAKNLQDLFDAKPYAE
ncbi:High affinity transport system protein p37 [Chlamydia trachomatis]|nr:High affinity transport system protein p37 [Chlamydia trachomatis]